jgi:hypothetical protein
VGKPPLQNREAKELEGTKKQEPPHSVETHRAEADDTDKARQSGSSTHADHPREGRAEKKQSSPPESLPLEPTGNGQPESDDDPHPLLGDSSKPQQYDNLADALAAAKTRWAEVNQEALEANTLPGQAAEEETNGARETEGATAEHVPSSPDPSRHEAPKATGGEIRTPRFSPSAETGSGTKAASQDVPMSSDLHRQSVIRYQSFAMALSNPHQTRPIIDVFV